MLNLRNFLNVFERVVILLLVFLMAVVVLISTVELGWVIISDIISAPVFFIEINELLDVFGFFLLILIGVELLETIRTYSEERRVRVEVVLLVALIAVARKIIILDIEKVTSLTLIGLGTIIIALTAGYYLFKLSSKNSNSNKD